MPGVLGHEIVVDQGDEGVGQGLGHRSGNGAVTEGHPVDRPHRADAEAGRGDEGFVGRIAVIGAEVRLYRRYAAFRRQLQDRLAGGTETLVTGLLSLLDLGAMRTEEKFGGKAK